MVQGKYWMQNNEVLGRNREEENAETCWSVRGWRGGAVLAERRSHATEPPIRSSNPRAQESICNGSKLEMERPILN
jgi:hypothetical protein